MYKTLRSDTIKIIAMILMLVDHIAAGIIEPWYLSISDVDFALSVYNFTRVLRGFGRLAFPIFCYQIAVGLIHTSSRMKYVRNLTVFALISEMAYDFTFGKSLFDMSDQNVFFTLLLGMLCVCILDSTFYSEYFGKFTHGEIVRLVFSAPVIWVFCYIAEKINSDYGAKGVLIILVMYILVASDRRDIFVPVGVLSFIVIIFLVTLIRKKALYPTINYVEYESIGLLAFPIMAMDNGQRRGGKALKWFGYVFYPGHILIIGIIAKLLFG